MVEARLSGGYIIRDYDDVASSAGLSVVVAVRHDSVWRQTRGIRAILIGVLNPKVCGVPLGVRMTRGFGGCLWCELSF